MSKDIETIVIVGGGTAGWLSAVYLNRALNRAGERPCRITLIESSDIGIIGVGESTVPTLRDTFAFLGLDEVEWMTRCQATFKLAIKFVGWSGRSVQDSYWHPFEPPPQLHGLELVHYWLKRHLAGDQTPYDRSAYSVVAACEAGKAPKDFSDPRYEGQVRYAYHLDAGLLATYLKEVGKQRGIIHLVDHVQRAVLTEDGYLSHLITANSGDLYADFFLDCSGFRGLLINQTLGEPFIDDGESLLCDRAVTMAVPQNETEPKINPYTTATALSAGWAWHAPLFTRSGNGYVYASRFCSSDQAEHEFRTHLGPVADSLEARHLTMRVGRTRRAWVKNCVSIGLSSGFIEPLESTGIYLIEMGLQNLLTYFPDKDFDPQQLDRYNQLMAYQYEHIRDFIIMHYCLTQREDSPFWQANKYQLTIPASLQAKLALWRSALPIQEETLETGFFRAPSYACVLSGLNFLPERPLPILTHISPNEAHAAFDRIQAEAEHWRNKLPDHVKTLRRLQLYHELRQAYRAEKAI